MTAPSLAAREVGKRCVRHWNFASESRSSFLTSSTPIARLRFAKCPASHPWRELLLDPERETGGETDGTHNDVMKARPGEVMHCPHG